MNSCQASARHKCTSPNCRRVKLRKSRKFRTSLYYHRNQQYSITALTDTTGTISERYAYDAYGKLSVLDGDGTALSGSAYGNRYTYTGREWDGELGLYHYRARMYSPDSGRFVSRDPIGYGDGPNQYEFLSSQALSGVDPDGKKGFFFCKFVCGPCIASAIAVCGGICAGGAHWDVPGESFWSCSGKCALAIVSGDIAVSTTSGAIWSGVCATGCAGCVTEAIDWLKAPEVPKPIGPEPVEPVKPCNVRETGNPYQPPPQG